MEKTNYTQSEFKSRSEINVDILSIIPSKNKFGEYHQSHKIKVKYVCFTHLRKDQYLPEFSFFVLVLSKKFQHIF